MKNLDFSIVFPVMNQQDHIEKVIRSYHKELTKNKFSFELIAVVNCSTDNSFEACKKASRELSNVSSYELKECGYGLGILHGLKHAQGKYMCYLNCARIHTPELIKVLRYFLIDPTVIVHGVRQKRENVKRGFGSLLYNVFCRAAFRIPNRDINGNPNVFSREIYNKLQLRFADSMIDLELLEKSKKMRIPVVEVPIFDYSRHGGLSTSNFKTIFRLLKEVFRYGFITKILLRFPDISHTKV
ncbi:glycosyltransferase [Candidatus Roizmanbacteria bacterium]|nr:glycosyltransferase [Candidatus Roizmanbacteria bacterium]